MPVYIYLKRYNTKLVGFYAKDMRWGVDMEQRTGDIRAPCPITFIINFVINAKRVLQSVLPSPLAARDPR